MRVAVVGLLWAPLHMKVTVIFPELLHTIASTLDAHPAADVHHSARPEPRIPPGCPDRTPISCLLTDPLRRRDWLPQPWSGLLGVTGLSLIHI